MHQCPKRDCVAQVPDDQLACYPHWQQVPRALQRAVYAAWDHGRGQGSAAHRAAITRAVVAMNRAR